MVLAGNGPISAISFANAQRFTVGKPSFVS
jgi:hypothetical protein